MSGYAKDGANSQFNSCSWDPQPCSLCVPSNVTAASLANTYILKVSLRSIRIAPCASNGDGEDYKTNRPKQSSMSTTNAEPAIYAQEAYPEEGMVKVQMRRCLDVDREVTPAAPGIHAGVFGRYLAWIVQNVLITTLAIRPVGGWQLDCSCWVVWEA